MTSSTYLVNLPRLPIIQFPANEPLTPETFLAVLQTRMKDIDKQLQERLSALKNRTADAQRIQDKIAGLQNIMSELGRLETDDTIDVASLTEEQQRALAEAGFDTSAEEITLGGRVRADYDAGLTDGDAPVWVETEERTVTIPAHITKEEVDAKIKELTTHLNRVNSSNEMDMIQVQSLMSQRSNEIGLATNGLRNFHDGSSQIIQNI